MPDRSPPSAPYDRIAHLYDVDMASSMPFEDVSLYAELAKRAGGRVLELGCGNGRILLELLGSRIDAYGIDCSAAMLALLASKAARRALSAPVCRMDARALGFRRAFALALCPYSLITYMSGPGDAVAMLGAVRHALVAGGCVVIDAFIPKSDVSSKDFRLDYRRTYGDAVLTRSKRVAPIGPGLNRIERRYELVAADGKLRERIHTSEDIRVFAPEELLELLSACGFAIGTAWWDYAEGERRPGAQFFTVSARTPANAPRKQGSRPG
ncbi:MAG: class I SAM-dependent methyltransferase [Usitatibacter sp.]